MQQLVMDEAAVRHLTRELEKAVKGHLGSEPHKPEKVFEMLNAIAHISAALVGGSPDIRIAEMRGWFIRALDQALDAFDRQSKEAR